MPRELSNASSKYGASMGRHDTITEPDYPVKFHLVRLRWVGGDYDQGGAYWGGGMGDYIFHAWGDAENHEQEMFVRASDRFHARLLVCQRFDNARFYR